MSPILKRRMITDDVIDFLLAHGVILNTGEQLYIADGIETAYKLGKREAKKVPKKKTRKKNVKKNYVH